MSKAKPKADPAAAARTAKGIFRWLIRETIANLTALPPELEPWDLHMVRDVVAAAAYPLFRYVADVDRQVFFTVDAHLLPHGQAVLVLSIHTPPAPSRTLTIDLPWVMLVAMGWTRVGLVNSLQNAIDTMHRAKIGTDTD